MKSPSTDLCEETPEEQNRRINSMLRAMVVEGAVDAISKDEDPPEFSRTEISDFVGCSKDTIRRIEKEALRKVEKHLLQSKE